MKSRGLTPLGLWFSPLLLSLIFSACTDEETVYVERVLFEDPPEAAQGVLGYDDQDTKLTTCGNCHTGQQTKWQGTRHANAWTTLEESGHSQALCENCHSVGPLGNPASGTVGYAGAPEERYHDVQCESCHGAGLNHVTNPDDTQPQASIAILDGDAATKNCAECHTGAHHPFADEWVQSRHARPNSSPVNSTSSASCIPCHTGQGALKAWGVDDNYLEKNAPVSQHVGITCAVCHDPHSRANQAQLRFPIDVPEEDNNLCMKCHNRRANPDIVASTLRGPHAPEGPLLLGTAGWWPPDFSPEIDRIVASHGTTANPKLCATCHVAQTDVTDPATGDFVFHATGHLFKAAPCVDENGQPVADEECDVTERTFDSCATSGCHGTPEAARNAFVSANQLTTDYVEEIERLLTLVPPGEFNLSDGRFTVADGAWFNADLCKRKGSPTHNPFLTRQLLLASIDILETTYGLTASPNLDRAAR